VLESANEKAQKLVTELARLKVFDFSVNPGAKMEQVIRVKSDKGDLFVLEWGGGHDPKTGNSGRLYFARTNLFPETFRILEDDIAGLELEDLKKKEVVK